LGGKGGKEFLGGKRVSFRAMCDSAFSKGKDVASVSGDDNAWEESLFYYSFCAKVYRMGCHDALKASKLMGERALG
jgi:thioredoxin reductase (NADPH)